MYTLTVTRIVEQKYIFLQEQHSCVILNRSVAVNFFFVQKLQCHFLYFDIHICHKENRVLILTLFTRRLMFSINSTSFFIIFVQ